MISTAFLYLLGSLFGFLISLFSIIFRKHLPPWGLVFLVLLGLLIATACLLMFLVLGFFCLRLEQ